MRALTVETLVQKGKFLPEVAVAVAEAMDQAIGHADLVTVPILDARFAMSRADLDARFAVLNAHVDSRCARMETRLILWIVGSSVGTAYIPKVVSELGQLIAKAF